MEEDEKGREQPRSSWRKKRKEEEKGWGWWVRERGGGSGEVERENKDGGEVERGSQREEWGGGSQ